MKKVIKTYPKAVNALWIGDEVEDILSKSKYSMKLHSIFNHAINFVDNGDYIITVLNEYYPIGPQTVILSREDFHAIKALNLNRETVYDFRSIIDIKHAGKIEFRVRGKVVPPSYEEADRNIQYFENILMKKGNKAGLLSKGNIYADYAAPSLEGFRQNLSCGSIREAAESLCHIVGLGPGLTPSGDDFILGLLASFYQSYYAFGINESFIKIMLELILNKVKGKTTLVSYNMLRLGAKGKYSEWVESMAFSILYGSKSDIEKSFQSMMKIGSTSGSDMGAGMLFGYKLILRQLSKGWNGG